MMRRIFLFLLFFSFCTIAFAQYNNAIFNGAKEDGLGVMFYYSKRNNTIFAGANNDGFTITGAITMLHNTLFSGGIDDGFHSLQWKNTIQNNVYYGGLDDGWSGTYFNMDQNNMVWSGGADDGWTSGELIANLNNLVFIGGSDDGFSNSGISKMIWNGSISDEWLVAGNWTPHVVPGKNDAAWIPQVNTYYPILKAGMLGLSLNKTYSCKELHIEPFASITLNNEVGFISNGYLGVKGALHFLGVGTSSFEILEGAVMDVEIGGLLNILDP